MYNCVSESSKAEGVSTSKIAIDFGDHQPKPGDTIYNVIKKLEFQWTEAHITKEEMWKMMYGEVDPLGDAIYKAMRRAGAKTLFPWAERGLNMPSLHERVETHVSTTGLCLADPPADIIAKEFLPAIRELNEMPDWVDQKLVEEGQVVFLTYMAPIGITQLMTLLGGFGCPEINKVLIESRYWVNKGKKGSRDTHRRLLDTGEFINKLMQPGQLKPGGVGFQACLEIRMLHSGMRRRLAAQQKPPFNTKKFGQPINQLHLACTLSGFQYNSIYWLYDIFGIQLSERERDAYTMVWRYIGFILGIRNDINPLKSFEESKIWWESMIVNIIRPDDSTDELVHFIVRSIVENGSGFLGHRSYHTMFRIALGDMYGDKLHLYNSKILKFTTKIFFSILGIVHTQRVLCWPIRNFVYYSLKAFRQIIRLRKWLTKGWSSSPPKPNQERRTQIQPYPKKRVCPYKDELEKQNAPISIGQSPYVSADSFYEPGTSSTNIQQEPLSFYPVSTSPDTDFKESVECSPLNTIDEKYTMYKSLGGQQTLLLPQMATVEQSGTLHKETHDKNDSSSINELAFLDML